MLRHPETENNCILLSFLRNRKENTLQSLYQSFFSLINFYVRLFLERIDSFRGTKYFNATLLKFRSPFNDLEGLMIRNAAVKVASATNEKSRGRREGEASREAYRLSARSFFIGGEKSGCSRRGKDSRDACCDPCDLHMKATHFLATLSLSIGRESFFFLREGRRWRRCCLGRGEHDQWGERVAIPLPLERLKKETVEFLG